MPASRREFLAAAGVVAMGVSFTEAAMQNSVSLTVDLESADSKNRLSKHLYGHFAEHLGRCVYDGIWVGPDSPIPNTKGYRSDLLDALKALRIPNLRWPGGCFADDYHWRDGIGPRDKRPRTVNIHWGNYVEDNSFGTHEFMDLCELLNCDAYVAFNVGSGTPAEMRAWLEYMTFGGDSTLANERRANGRAEPWRLPFVGIGNENWGCGGNMTPEYYSDLYNQFAVYARDFGKTRLTRVACGVNAEDYNWAEVTLNKLRGAQGISWHYYSLPGDWKKKGPALTDDVAQWHALFRAGHKLEEILTRADTIFDKADPDNRIGIYFDEWGAWYDTQPGDTALYQQNTIRDALLASLSFDIFHKHSRRVRMANIAQVVNVLQSVILTERGGDNRMVKTPTYHAFDLYRPHMGATHVPIKLQSPDYAHDGNSVPQLSASASLDDAGTLHVSLTNLHHADAAKISIDITGKAKAIVTGRILTADKIDAHNTFDQPDAVKIADFAGAKLDAGKLTVTLPARSVVTLAVK